MIEFVLSVFMCSHCTQVFNSSVTCEQHESETHARNEGDRSTIPNDDGDSQTGAQQDIEPSDDDIIIDSLPEAVSLVDQVSYTDAGHESVTDSGVEYATVEASTQKTMHESHTATLEEEHIVSSEVLERHGQLTVDDMHVKLSEIEPDYVDEMDQSDDEPMSQHGEEPIEAKCSLGQTLDKRSAAMILKSKISGATCHQCGRQFARASQLTVHDRHSVPTTDRSVKCAQCCQYFKDKPSRTTHIRRFHVTPRSVTVDEASYERQKEFVRTCYVTMKNEGRCTICEVQVSHRRASKLQQHLTRHCDERPFRCDLCDKRCKVRHSLRSHICTTNKKTENGSEMD